MLVQLKGYTAFKCSETKSFTGLNDVSSIKVLYFKMSNLSGDLNNFK